MSFLQEDEETLTITPTTMSLNTIVNQHVEMNNQTNVQTIERENRMSTRVVAAIHRISVLRHVDTIDKIYSISTMQNKDSVATSSGHVQQDIVSSQINVTFIVNDDYFGLFGCSKCCEIVNLPDNFTFTGASTPIKGLKDCTMGFEFEGAKGSLNI